MSRIAVDDEGVTSIRASHDIGIVTASKLVAIFWAGLLPVIFPAWLIVQGEIRWQNHIQDSEIAANYVSRTEYNDLKDSIRELKEEVHKLRDLLMVVPPAGKKP